MTEGRIPFELELLAEGHRYPQWVADAVKAFRGTGILEVGAGVGNISQ